MNDPIFSRESSRRRFLQGLIAAGTAGVASRSFAMQAPKRTAVVVGAGIAGLSCAYELRKAGFDVAILEKWDYTGGRMREAWMGPLYGFTHAAGVSKFYREMFDLAREVGVADELDGDAGDTPIDNGVGTYGYGLRFHADEIARIPGLSADTKRRLPVIEADMKRIREEGLDPCLMYTAAAWDDEPLDEYFYRVLGKEAGTEVLRYWIDPLLSWWGWPSDRTSRAPLLTMLAQNQDLIAPRGGIGVLTRRLAKLLPVQTRTTVRFITPPDADGRHTVHYLASDLQPRTVKPDVVVVATEGKYVSLITQGLTAQQKAFFDSIDTTKEAILWYVLDDKAAPSKPDGGFYIPTHPDPIKSRVYGWTVNPAEPENHNRPATVWIDLQRPEVPKWQVSGKTMPDYCQPLLEKLYPAFDMRHVTDIVNYTCEDLIYMPVGYLRQAAAIVREQERSRRGLYFAGEYVSGALTGSACASGRVVGRTIARHWS